MYVFALVMMGAGTLGVPRRHWDISFAGNALPYEFPGAAYLMMALVGIARRRWRSSAADVHAGHGRLGVPRQAHRDAGLPARARASDGVAPTAAPVAAAHGGGIGGGLAAPGTFALAMVFLTAFVLYYFINWKYLSHGVGR